MRFIDVTLRDGGHCVGFNWHEEHAAEYVSLSLRSGLSSFVEIGYWKQHGKFDGRFYRIDEKLLELLPEDANKRLAIMSDFHYLISSVEDFPSPIDSSVGLLRLTSRKEDVKDALGFLQEVRAKKQILTSLNIFNVSNYSSEDLESSIASVLENKPDFVYFADTHGALDLGAGQPALEAAISHLIANGIEVGLHLHDHRGLAFANYSKLPRLGVNLTDVSLLGLGKGAGNLRLENVAPVESLTPFLDYARNYPEYFNRVSNPLYSLTGLYSTTDHYADQSAELGLDTESFERFLKGLDPLSRDNFNSKLLIAHQTKSDGASKLPFDSVKQVS